MLNKKSTLFHYGLLGALLIYSFMFYKTITWELAALSIIFILLEPKIFIEAKKNKGLARIGFSLLLLTLISFNLLAISSNFINIYNKESEVKTLNNKYVRQQEKLKQLKSSITSIETELNSYPTLEAFTSKSPKWEDKTQLNQTWQDGKKDINNRLTTAQQEYNKELSTNIDKYKITNKDNGYNAIFTAISQKINVKTSNLTIIIYMLFAVVLEIFIFYTKVLSVKESKNYKKTAKELINDAVVEGIEESVKNYLESFRSFNKSLSQNNLEEKEQIFVKVYEQPKHEKEEVKQIEEAKEVEEQEEVEEVKEQLFTPKVLNLDNLQKVFDYIQENKTGDIAPGIKKISDNTEIATGEVGRIRDALIKFGYLQPDNKQTIILKENLNLGDFEGGNNNE